jgi:fructan beta-fructosidase
MRKAVVNILGMVLCCLSAVAAQEGPAATNKSREFSLEKKYLNLPVKNGARKRLVNLRIDNTVVHEFEIELAPDEPDYWSFSMSADSRARRRSSV